MERQVGIYGGNCYVEKSKSYFEHSSWFIHRSFHWTWYICILGLQNTSRFVRYVVSPMVHEHFSLSYIYDYPFGGSYYYKADDSEKAKVNSQFVGISKSWKIGGKYVRININDEYW